MINSEFVCDLDTNVWLRFHEETQVGKINTMHKIIYQNIDIEALIIGIGGGSCTGGIKILWFLQQYGYSHADTTLMK